MWLLESIDCNRTVDLGSMDAQTLSNTLWAFANIGECPRWIMDETARYMRPHEPQQQHIARARIISLLLPLQTRVHAHAHTVLPCCSHRPCKLRQRELTHSHAFRNGPYGQRLCTLCHAPTCRPPVALSLRLPFLQARGPEDRRVQHSRRGKPCVVLCEARRQVPAPFPPCSRALRF